MGASADQMEREIRETRERLDENLGVLESRAVSNAVRYGRIAAIALVVTGAGGAGFLIYRRLRRPGLRERIEGLSPESLSKLAVEIGTRVKEQFPSVTVTVNEKKNPEPGRAQSILRKVAPTLIATFSTAAVRKIFRGSEVNVQPRRAAYD